MGKNSSTYVLWYLENEREEEYETNQHFVGMKELFRGYAVIDWERTYLQCTKHRHLNAIIVKECAEFHNKCWKYRNEIYHDANRQNDKMMKWFEKKRKVEECEYRQIRLHANKCRLDVNVCQCDAIKRWIMNLKRIEKKAEKIPPNDIRRFMIL